MLSCCEVEVPRCACSTLMARIGSGMVVGSTVACWCAASGGCCSGKRRTVGGERRKEAEKGRNERRKTRARGLGYFVKPRERREKKMTTRSSDMVAIGWYSGERLKLQWSRDVKHRESRSSGGRTTLNGEL